MTAQTSKAAIERMQKVSAILTERLSGKSLAEIGQAQDPPVSPQAIQQMVQRVLRSQISETVEQARSLELMRLDQLLAAIWQRALDGDIACVDRCLAIMTRRARLLGLDLQPSAVFVRGAADGVETDADGRPIVRVTIENSPEVQRMEWLEERSERLREIEAGDTDGEPTGPRSVN